MYKTYHHLSSGAQALIEALDAAEGGYPPADSPSDLYEARKALDKGPIFVTDDPFEGAIPPHGAKGWWIEVTEHGAALTVRKQPIKAWRRWSADRRFVVSRQIHPCGHDERMFVTMGEPGWFGEKVWPIRNDVPSVYKRRGPPKHG